MGTLQLRVRTTELYQHLRSVTDRFLGVESPANESLSTGERNIRTDTLHGAFNSMALNMVGPFTAIYAIRLGASTFEVALLTSGPALVSLFAMIPGARLVDRTAKKKRMTFAFMLANRLFYLFLASIPFFAVRSQAIVFVLLLALMNLPGAIANVAWQAFISRIIPPDKRARAFAARSRLMNVVGTTITMITAIFLDHSRYPLGYQFAFLGAFLIAAVELLVFWQIEADERTEGDERLLRSAIPLVRSMRAGFEQPLSAIVRVRNYMIAAVLRDVSEVMRERRFVRYTLISIVFYLTWQIPWPLFSWYQVRILHANNLWVSILALMNSGGAFVGFRFWQRQLERRGNLDTLIISTLPIFIVPLVYAASQQLWTIGIANLVIGAIFAGVNLALFNMLLEVTPEERKATFIAYYSTAVTATGVLAPVIGVSFLSVVNIHVAFLFAALLRLVGSLAFLLMRRLERQEDSRPLVPFPRRTKRLRDRKSA